MPKSVTEFVSTGEGDLELFDEAIKDEKIKPIPAPAPINPEQDKQTLI